MAVGSLIGTVTVLAESNAQIKDEKKQTENALGREKQLNDELTESMEREARAKYRQNINWPIGRWRRTTPVVQRSCSTSARSACAAGNGIT